MAAKAAVAVIMNDADTEEMRKCGVIRIGGTKDDGRDREEAPKSERERAEVVEPEPAGLA